MTPEDEEFNRIEMESRIKQDYVRDIKQPSREQLMAEVTVLTELVRVLSDRVKELEGVSMTRPIGISVPHRRVEDDDDIQEYKRPWVDLTKEECFELCVKHKDNSFSLLVAVQDKLKEKNT